MTPIKFGTSGWRGLIARDFTFANVRLAAQGVADYLLAERAQPASAIAGRKPVVILAHDTRFLGREFALAVAEVLAANGLSPLLCNRDTPTPVVAHTIRVRKAIGGINMTASHNPAEYQGLKFSTSNGAPAPPEVTRQIEAHIARRQAEGWHFNAAVVGTYSCPEFDPQPAYFKKIRQLVDFEVIRRAQIKVAVEIRHGTGRGYLDALLTQAGARVTVFGANPDPLFGGYHPEPDARGMAEACAFVRARKARLAVGVDGDADRFGIVDTDGAWLTPNQILALALYHLKKNRGWTGSVVRTVPTSHQVDAVAALLGVKVHETPVGFKYIGALMESEPVIVGGEESGGLSVKGHVPEKDGILACLLMVELVARERKSLGSILRALAKKTGEFHTERLNLRIAPEQKDAILGKLEAGLEAIGSFPVQQFITTDGYKFLLPENEWVAFRASGTEPLIRCYIEAKSTQHLARLRKACKTLLRG
ncbi:MAG TPA: phosphoglucomutase/phosphomannomutase family protein [Verrucomicrobiota bacterium]|jgi:alpha-D-glucose phosphate-specific phosphoglucomutase|nr:phosphoglucomutase/phosphomannomutase family protein [Verrucomicrobiota bacterium]OQB92340.1 MAG: Phosphoglucomutase [Verrucomicrobia bacterium ADurb.Bin118]HPY29961.1 phosphoglucomutase/phosphomannomutase family protein [Verrucomicrobiota bacterium]HQB16613.1 phosphoglucomutase/phosphomannomutase family protein [Verrucomicrobiota bacterium]